MSAYHAYRLSVLVASALLVIGCANPARQRSERAVGSLQNTRDELSQGMAQVDEVLATLVQLEARPADLNPIYNKFASQVNALENRAEAVGRRVRDMRVRSAEYNAAWQAENQTIDNPDLREAANRRNERVSDRYLEIDSRAQEVRAAFDPLIDELRDLETFLSNDLTYAGVAAAQPVFEKVRDRAETLREKVRSLQQELDDSYNRLSPATAPVS